MLKTIPITNLTQGQVLGAWALFCLSYAINAWGGLWPALLSGIGYVGSATLISIIVQVVSMIAKIVVVLTGGGLISLAAVECVAGVANRQIMLVYLRWKEPTVFTMPGRWSSTEFRSQLNPAMKLWFTSLGAFLILYTDQFFIGYFLGVAAIANYRAGLRRHQQSLYDDINIFTRLDAILQPALACRPSDDISHRALPKPDDRTRYYGDWHRRRPFVITRAIQSLARSGPFCWLSDPNRVLNNAVAGSSARNLRECSPIDGG